MRVVISSVAKADLVGRGLARLTLCFALTLSPALAGAEAPVAELSAAKVEAVEAAVTTAMARLGIPGASVAIASGSTLRFATGYGLADVENGVPAKAVTAYRLASVSKPMTAVAVLKLVEEGKLDLDAPIQRYVPSLPEKAFPVTSRQLAELGVSADLAVGYVRSGCLLAWLAECSAERGTHRYWGRVSLFFSSK